MDLPSGSFTILLSDRTDDAGKVTICKLLLGIIKPTSGTILIDGKDASKVPTQKRNAAMVHQEFINYPHLTVYENIASPLRVLKIPKTQIRKAVYDIAKKLRIESCLNLQLLTEAEHSRLGSICLLIWHQHTQRSGVRRSRRH